MSLRSPYLAQFLRYSEIILIENCRF